MSRRRRRRSTCSWRPAWAAAVALFDRAELRGQHQDPREARVGVEVEFYPLGLVAHAANCGEQVGAATFFYSPTGDSESVKRFLGTDLARTVQCDGTSITNFLERAGGKRPGCWAHALRRLVEAARGGDLVALEGVRIIARLFAVERVPSTLSVASNPASFANVTASITASPCSSRPTLSSRSAPGE